MSVTNEQLIRGLTDYVALEILPKLKLGAYEDAKKVMLGCRLALIRLRPEPLIHQIIDHPFIKDTPLFDEEGNFDVDLAESLLQESMKAHSNGVLKLDNLVLSGLDFGSLSFSIRDVEILKSYINKY